MCKNYFLYILVIVVITIVLLYVIFQKYKVMPWGLDPKKNISKHGVFWYFIVGPILISTPFFLQLYCELGFNWSAAGFERFSDKSKIPILIIGTIIPLSLMINRIHATEQTAEQLRKSEAQLSAALEQNEQINRKNDIERSQEYLNKISEIYKAIPNTLSNKDSRLRIKYNKKENIDFKLVVRRSVWENIYLDLKMVDSCFMHILDEMHESEYRTIKTKYINSVLNDGVFCCGRIGFVPPIAFTGKPEIMSNQNNIDLNSKAELDLIKKNYSPDSSIPPEKASYIIEDIFFFVKDNESDFDGGELTIATALFDSLNIYRSAIDV